MFRNLICEVQPPAAILALNRPERRNALSLQLMEELIEALGRAGANPEVRAVVLAASGTTFCSGHDLSELRGRGPEQYRRVFQTCVRLMRALRDTPQPVIAEVQGVATAAGCQLVAACDLAVASQEATFATPGVRIGLFCSTPMVALSRAIGPKRA
ncbi:MAG: enoyl-CoA hydratase-related protein, partial [Bryobacteraceae bacterium]